MNFEIIPDQQTPGVPVIGFSDSKSIIEDHREELAAFLSFAETQYSAVGLAANQCSIDGERFMLRVFALRNLRNTQWSLVINPFITQFIGMNEHKSEGCLTWKRKKIIASRFRAVEVQYYTMDGEKVVDEVHYGFEGQIWQHEINHLNGVEENVVELTHPEPSPIDVGRNDQCPCGSGLKYKKCCLSLI